MRNGVGEATGGTWPTYCMEGGGGWVEEEQRWRIKEWERKIDKKVKEVRMSQRTRRNRGWKKRARGDGEVGNQIKEQ